MGNDPGLSGATLNADGLLSFGTNATVVYNMDGADDNNPNTSSRVDLNYDFNSGSGSGDMYAYIPTALFTGQNLVTIGAIRALRELGLQRSVALVGFDDVVLGDLVEPGITVVAQDPYALGRHAGELLFTAADEPRTVVVPTTLIARGSGEIPAV